MPSDPHFEPVHGERRPGTGRRSRGPAMLVTAVLAVVALGLGAWWYWHSSTDAEPPLQAQAPAAAPPAPAPAATAAAPASPRHPIETPSDVAPSTPATMAEWLASWLPAGAMKLLQLDEFPRRVVVTVDNLPRAQASARLWPVDRTPGQLRTVEIDGRLALAPDNAARYEPLVVLIEEVGAQRIASAYRRLYPLLQRAHEENGYPGRYFNDRLVEAIDDLLASPERQGPLFVEPTRVKGPMPLSRPWEHMVYADADLEALSAGQKIMLRVGPEQARRLKIQLRALREAITVPVAPAAR